MICTLTKLQKILVLITAPSISFFTWQLTDLAEDTHLTLTYRQKIG